MRMLKEDILNYGTLADFMRRIMNFKEDSVKDLEVLKKELGADYPNQRRIPPEGSEKEIIMAIESKYYGETRQLNR